MIKGNSGMGHKKHRQCAIHGMPVSQYAKDAVAVEANKATKRPQSSFHESIKELMKAKK